MRRATQRWGHRDDATAVNDDSYSEYMETPDRRRQHNSMILSEAGASLSADALDAHRQVLEMAATIEILTRDLETQQQELLRAYERLNEYASKESVDGVVECERSSPSAKLFRPRTSHRPDDDTSNETSDGACGKRCPHWSELHELRKLVDVKDTALTEALQQRNEYRVELERAEAHIRDLRSAHLDATGGSRGAWKVHPTASNMSGYHATGSAMPCTHASLVPGFASSGSASGLQSSSTGGAIDVPRHERFDHESTYQRRENDELYWRKQYKEAVRMRKKYGLVPPSSSAAAVAAAAMASSSSHVHRSSSSSSGAARPSLKIFSYPDNRRQKGITDENVPFSRYIGISARQHEIIKEHHRMLA